MMPEPAGCPRGSYLVVSSLRENIRENRAFAESKNLWREPFLRLSAKNSSPRVKKETLGEEKNSR
jgi:hypothetical protein